MTKKLWLWRTIKFHHNGITEAMITERKTSQIAYDLIGKILITTIIKHPPISIMIHCSRYKHRETASTPAACTVWCSYRIIQLNTNQNYRVCKKKTHQNVRIFSDTSCSSSAILYTSKNGSKQTKRKKAKYMLVALVLVNSYRPTIKNTLHKEST